MNKRQEEKVKETWRSLFKTKAFVCLVEDVVVVLVLLDLYIIILFPFYKFLFYIVISIVFLRVIHIFLFERERETWIMNIEYWIGSAEREYEGVVGSFQLEVGRFPVFLRICFMRFKHVLEHFFFSFLI